MEVVIILVLAFAGLMRLRLARRIAGTPLGSGPRGRWIVRFNQALGLALLLAAVLWALLRR